MDPKSPESRLELLGLPGAEWETTIRPLLEELVEPRYRVRQLREWVFRKTPADFGGMSDLPAALRQRLAERTVLHPLTLLEERISRDGTRKYLWRRRDDLRGNGAIESVMIPEDSGDEGDRDTDVEKRSRTTYCLSTQAGCPVKCTFCATGYGGFEGQLSAGEIVDQVVLMRRLSGRPPTNIVFMGMGEPLLNFESTARSIEVLRDPGGLGLGSRRITVSTVGVPEKIAELGRRFPQVKLALSLHAAREDLRTELIPLNRKHSLASVLAAVREHGRATQKIPTLEYVVLPGVNDTRDDARAIARALAGIPSRINLIEFNPFPGAEYRKPSVPRMEEFRASIRDEGFPGVVTIRRSRGEDIHGACGQLSLAAGRSVAPQSPPVASAAGYPEV